MLFALKSNTTIKQMYRNIFNASIPPLKRAVYFLKGVYMTTETIKAKLEELLKTNPNINISLRFQSPRLTVENSPAVLKGVYRYIFQVEENTGRLPRVHSIKYTDVLVGRVKIQELEQI